MNEKEKFLIFFGRRLKSARLNANLSQEKLAEKVGTSKSVISGYETGKNDPAQSMVIKLASVLSVPINYLMGWEEEQNKNTIDLSNYPNILPISTKKIPLLGEIACGKPLFATESRESYVESGTDIKADFCLKCKGDSMINARIYDGDIVFIRKQSQVENGEIAAVLIDEEATLKRVYYHKGANILELRPENSKYNTLIYAEDKLNEIKILGKAIAFQSDVR